MLIKFMAWGLWNKIKQGIKKAGRWVKDKILKPVVNNVIKPFKPVISTVATAINPKVGALVSKGMDVAERWSDDGARVDKEQLANNGVKAVQWAKNRWGK